MAEKTTVTVIDVTEERALKAARELGQSMLENKTPFDINGSLPDKDNQPGSVKVPKAQR